MDGNFETCLVMTRRFRMEYTTHGLLQYTRHPDPAEVVPPLPAFSSQLYTCPSFGRVYKAPTPLSTFLFHSSSFSSKKYHFVHHIFAHNTRSLISKAA